MWLLSIVVYDFPKCQTKLRNLQPENSGCVRKEENYLNPIKLSEVISHLCNSIKTTKDNLVNVAVKKERCPLNKDLLKETINILSDLLRQLHPFNHTIDSDSRQLDYLNTRNALCIKQRINPNKAEL